MPVAVAIAVSLVSGTVSAAPPAQVDDAARDAARRLGYEGIAAYKSGDYGTALDKLDRAYAIVSVPTLGLWLARALVKRGRWVRAAERYLQVARATNAEGDPAVQAEARETAARERAALMPRIPQLTIVLRGPDPKDVVTTLDGNAINPALIGISFAVDPGEHDLEVRGARVVTRKLTAQEGAARSIEIELPRGPLVVPVSDAWKAVEVTRATRLHAAIGLGIAAGASAIFAGAFGGAAIGASNAAKTACPNPAACPTNTAHDDSQRARSFATVSNAGFAVAGSALLGAGILWLSAPRVDRPAVEIGVGASSVLLKGSF